MSPMVHPVHARANCVCSVQYGKCVNCLLNASERNSTAYIPLKLNFINMTSTCCFRYVAHFRNARIQVKVEFHASYELLCKTLLLPSTCRTSSARNAGLKFAAFMETLFFADTFLTGA